MEVTSPPGSVVGSIHQKWDILYPRFSVRNASGDVVLLIEGPFCTYSCCGDVEFKVLLKILFKIFIGYLIYLFNVFIMVLFKVLLKLFSFNFSDKNFSHFTL